MQQWNILGNQNLIIIRAAPPIRSPTKIKVEFPSSCSCVVVAVQVGVPDTGGVDDAGGVAAGGVDDAGRVVAGLSCDCGTTSPF